MADRILNLGSTHRIIVNDTTNTAKLQWNNGSSWIDVVGYDTVNQVPVSGGWPSVKRNLTGGIVWSDVATGLTTGTTTTGTPVSTNTTITDQALYTQAVLSLTGSFTTATATLLRNGSTLTSLTTTGSTTVSNSVSLTGTNTWTASVSMAAGTSATAGLTARRESRTSIIPR